MNDKDLLKSFCFEGLGRDQLKEPWSVGDYSYASNGAIGVRIPKVDGLTGNGPNLEKLIVTAISEIAEMLPFNIALAPPMFQNCATCNGTGLSQECKHCDGEGEIEFDCEAARCRHTYSVTCHECDGTGKLSSDNSEDECPDCDGEKQIRLHTSTQFGSRVFNDVRLEKILALPNPKLQTDGRELSAAYFTFDGGDGIIMPARQPTRNNPC